MVPHWNSSNHQGQDWFLQCLGSGLGPIVQQRKEGNQIYTSHDTEALMNPAVSVNSGVYLLYF